MEGAQHTWGEVKAFLVESDVRWHGQRSGQLPCASLPTAHPSLGAVLPILPGVTELSLAENPFWPK